MERAKEGKGTEGEAKGEGEGDWERGNGKLGTFALLALGGSIDARPSLGFERSRSML